MLEFNKAKVREALLGKPPLLAVAFATACAHRLVNSLATFQQYDSQMSIARKALNALHQHLAEGVRVPEGIEDQILAMIPDEDDDSSFAAAVLDDALAAVVFAVRTSNASTIDFACDAAARALDTAFRYSTQAINESTFTDSSIRMAMEGSVVQCELERQNRDLGEISDGLAGARVTAARIEERASTEAVI